MKNSQLNNLGKSPKEKKEILELIESAIKKVSDIEKRIIDVWFVLELERNRKEIRIAG